LFARHAADHCGQEIDYVRLPIESRQEVDWLRYVGHNVARPPSGADVDFEDIVAKVTQMGDQWSTDIAFRSDDECAHDSSWDSGV